MVASTSIYQDLFDHNDWANQRIFQLCADLRDDQLDEPAEMGFGSLRNTLFHNLEAEKLWLERWLGQPWRPLQADAEGMPVAEISSQAQDVAKERNEMIAREEHSKFSRVVEFKDSREVSNKFPIGPLLHHVANHGIHHRAQALNLMKRHGQTVPAGLDYLFWKMSRPSCALPAESLEPLRAYGLEAATAEGRIPQFDAIIVERYFTYSEWAMTKVLEAAADLDDAHLDQVFEMGMTTLRKTMQHMLDAERWWLDNWQRDLSPFPREEVKRSLSELTELFRDICRLRNSFIQSLDGESANRIVNVTAGGPSTCFRVVESLLQLCGHGTHHRAQCLNMLRHLGAKPPAIDLIVWVREHFV